MAPKDKNALTYTAFLAMGWTFTGVALILSIGRFVIRHRTLRKFQADDYCHAFSMFMLLVFTSMYTRLFPYSETVAFYGAGLGPKPSASYIVDFFKLQVSTEFFFWIVLFSVKFTFLLFYRHLFRVSKIFMRAWWCVFVFTAACFLACFLTPLWACQTPGHLFELKYCLSPRASGVVDNFAETGTALNIASDLAIIALPLWMLRTLKISRKSKIGLACIFLVGIIVVVFDCFRIGLGDGSGVINMASTWDMLEPCMAVIVATLPTFNVIFTLPKKRSSGGSSYWWSRSNRSQRSDPKREYVNVTDSKQPGYEMSKSTEALHGGVIQRTEAYSVDSEPANDANQPPSFDVRVSSPQTHVV